MDVGQPPDGPAVRRDHGEEVNFGPFKQVSRLGSPLFNEVIVPMGKKDLWNSLPPADDKGFANFVAHPELAGLPSGVVPGFQNFTGPVQADMLRLNTAIPPTTGNPSIFGLLGGDAGGFPNGRRVFDDVVSIEFRAIAGVTFALVDKTFRPDAAAAQLTDGLTPDSLDIPFLDTFPYLGVPHSCFTTPAS